MTVIKCKIIPFDATINWKSVLENLQKSNYNGPITLEICYRNRYLDISLEDFYEKAYAVGERMTR